MRSYLYDKNCKVPRALFIGVLRIRIINSDLLAPGIRLIKWTGSTSLNSMQRVWCLFPALMPDVTAMTSAALCPLFVDVGIVVKSRYLPYLPTYIWTVDLFFSLSDLSVWCYGCENYVDNAALYPAKNAAHRHQSLLLHTHIHHNNWDGMRRTGTESLVAHTYPS